MSSLPPDARKSAVVELVRRHRDGLRFGEDLKKTEIPFSDDYLLLAAHLILSATEGAASPLTDRAFQVLLHFAFYGRLINQQENASNPQFASILITNCYN